MLQSMMLCENLWCH